jgi:hypothetical protein
MAKRPNVFVVLLRVPVLLLPPLGGEVGEILGEAYISTGLSVAEKISS